jgi:hypothetical protein
MFYGFLCATLHFIIIIIIIYLFIYYYSCYYLNIGEQKALLNQHIMEKYGTLDGKTERAAKAL